MHCVQVRSLLVYGWRTLPVLPDELGHHPDVGHEECQTLGTDRVEGVDSLELKIVRGEEPSALGAEPDNEADDAFRF